MDKEYLDARFDGLEKLMTNQNENLDSHLRAVSTNVKEVRQELQAHKESVDAHGAGIIARSKSEWVSIVAAVVAAGSLLVDVWHRKTGGG